jgi:aryl-alcohol dehydrogenase-like predicted oxidoreductase
MDLGVNFIDTAEAYGTEEIVGEAISSVDRSSVVVSTKVLPRRGGEPVSGPEFAARIDASLKRLATDHVDVFHVHAVTPQEYERVHGEILPVLLAARDAGKIRHTGITASPPRDPEQTMLERAVADGDWDVVMLGFHMMNQGPARSILPATRKKGIGTLAMFVVRNIFSQPERLRATLAELAERGAVPEELARAEKPLDFLLEEGGAASLTDAAYRFARHAEGIDVVLFGTSRIEHLQSNIASIDAPPLPRQTVETLHRLFGALTGVGLDAPDRLKKAS